METNQSMSDGQESRGFYLPAVSGFTKAPGRVEQFLTSHLRDKSRLVFGATPSQPSKAFYLPAMAVLSNVPGRVERWVTERIKNHDIRGGTGELRQEVREFYLPGSAFSPRLRRNRPAE